MKDLYLLNPEITFLNHGSFGACPKPVFEEYQRWQHKLEQQPVEFMARDIYDYLKEARDSLGKFVGCSGDDLVYVTNPTTAVNTIIRSLDFGPGDEILTTDQEYGALIRTWNQYADKRGFKLVEHVTQFPMTTHEDFVNKFWSDVNEKTKVIFISQITSATGVILPAEEICRRAKAEGIMTIIDGAHVPAHIPLSISEMDPDVYVGACHKWLSAPKGSSFMYVKNSLQENVNPLIISWGSEVDPSPSPFIYENQYQGTWDPSAFLTVPSAIQFQIDNDWESVKKRCRNLTQETRDRVYDIIKTEPICPNNDEWLGQMSSIIINIENGLEFKWMLLDKYKIEMPIYQWKDKILFRISFNAYNDEKDADRLIEVLEEMF
jgi:isopenicillin-N epimerase